MSEQLAEEALREKGLAALDRELGRVEALRFLAMISRQPFDYQRWRREQFDEMSIGEVLAQSEPTSQAE